LVLSSIDLSKKQDRVVVVIPCYNEANEIYTVVRKCKYKVETVVVIDNNSTDTTRSEAEAAEAIVIKCKELGLGNAINTGISYCLDNYSDLSYIIVLDGDGQHKPSDLRFFLKLIDSSVADFITGTRFSSLYSGPPYRGFGIKFFTYVFNLFSSTRIDDCQCGFRAFNSKIAREVKLTSTGFDISIEQLVKIRKYGYSIAQVPIHCYYHRDFSRNSTLNPIIHGFQVFISLIKWRMWEIYTRGK